MSTADDKAREAEQSGSGMLEIDADQPATSAFDMLTATVLSGASDLIVAVLWTDEDGEGQLDLAATTSLSRSEVAAAMKLVATATAERWGTDA